MRVLWEIIYLWAAREREDRRKRKRREKSLSIHHSDELAFCSKKSYCTQTIILDNHKKISKVGQRSIKMVLIRVSDIRSSGGSGWGKKRRRRQESKLQTRRDGRWMGPAYKNWKWRYFLCIVKGIYLWKLEYLLNCFNLINGIYERRIPIP